jgi:diguanylate cyclase (GGDEF)-like protein
MRSLRLKILTLAALLVIGTQLGTLGAILFTASREVQQSAREDLAKAASILERALPMRADRLRNSMRLLATEKDFVATLTGSDVVAIETALFRAVERIEADLAVVLDTEGRVVAGQIRPQADPGAPLTIPPTLHRTIDDPETPGGTIWIGEHAFDFTKIPIQRDDGALRRWLAMGIAFDEKRIQRIEQMTGMRVAIISTEQPVPRVIATSLAPADAAVIGEQLARAHPTADRPLRIRTAQGEFFGVNQPLRAGFPEVSVLLMQSVDKALAPYRMLRLWAVILGLLALVVGIAGAAIVARAITRPLRQLAVATLRIRNGDYANAVDVTNDDELGMLADAFNTMQSGIAEREHRITYQAQFDALTGLPNRVLALARLEEAIAIAAGTNAPVSLLVVDLGSFGNIASALGHEIGDALLAQAAERLRASIDARHTVARLEADEFAIIVADLDADQARELAEDLLRLLSGGLSVRDVNISLNTVIGMAFYPEHALEPEQLLLRASVAKDDARSAQQTIHVYQDGREERRVRQLAILGDLRRAVRNNELKLYLQPIISLGDQRVCGAEALVRWDHPVYGWLPPGEFIGIAEQFGNISLVTHWALAAAVRECRIWIEEGLDLTVSVNLSSRDLLDQNLPLFILQLLRDHDLAARHLTLEVTEDALVRDFGRATLVLECLRDLGVRISIDDFGTGYSSLSQIRKLPVDELKVDRSFVMGLPESQPDAAIVKATIDLAHDLGLAVTAEGVENTPALQWLTQRGCEHAQGFLISRPMPAEAFVGWVERYDEAYPAGTDATLARAMQIQAV